MTNSRTKFLLTAIGVAASLPLVAGDARARMLAGNTLGLMAVVAAASLFVGSLLAVVLIRTDLPGRKTAVAALGLMLWVPLYLQAGAWQAGFGDQGWYTLASGKAAWLTGWTAVIWIHTLAAVPWVVLIVGAGLWLVEPELEEQALLDASGGRVLLRVTLRRSLAAFTAAGLWVAVSCGSEMTVTDLFQIRTYAEELYTQTAVEPDRAPLRVLPGVCLTVWLVAAGLALSAALAPASRRASNRSRVVFRLGAWRWPITCLVAAVLLVMAGLPLANLAFKAGLLVEASPAGYHRSWSFGKCLRMIVESLVRIDAGTLRPGRFLAEISWSLGIGAVAASLAVLAAAPLAWSARRGGPRAAVTWCVTGLALALPGPVVGLALIRLFNLDPLLWLYDLTKFDGYSQSIAAPALAQALRGLPLATLVLWHALRTVPQDTLDVAACGVGPLGRMLWIGLASRKPALGVAWLVALAMAVGELGASILVVPPRVKLLSVQIFNALHWGQEDHVSAACLAVLALLAALAALGRWLLIRLVPPNALE